MAGGLAFATIPSARDLTPAPPHRPAEHEPPVGFAGSTHAPGTVRLSPSRVPARPSGGAGLAGHAGGTEAVRQVIAAQGSPLDRSTRAAMEPRLGQDLGDVRVHTGPAAAASAGDLGASAYSVGRHVVFGAGRHQPGTDAGRQLMAHELTHVAQARGTPATPTGPLTLGDRHDPAEREAERHGAEATSARHGAGAGQPISAAAAGAVIRRVPDPPPGNAAPAPANPQPQAPMLPNPSLATVPPVGAGDSLTASASPFLAAAIASATVDGFPTGGSQLSPAQMEVLRTAAQRIVILLGKYPASTLSVVGHTDTVGSEASNVTLGKARAESAKGALLVMGVPAAAMTTSSAGEGPPQAVRTPNDVPSAKNRRVEVHFVPSALGTGANTSLQPAAPPPTPGGFGTAPPLGLPGPAQSPLPSGLGDPQPGPTQQPGPTNLFKKIPPSTVKQIQTLSDGLDAVANAVDRDKLVRGLRDAVAKITPFMSNKDAAKALDDAIKAGTTEGIKAAAKALLEALAHQSATDMPADPSHTMPLPGAPGEKMIPGPTFTSPFDKPPPLPPRSSYGYKNGPKATYKPGEKMTFTLLTPDTVPPGARLVLLASEDQSKDRPDEFAKVYVDQKGPKPIELTAPAKPGKYVLRVNVGFGWDTASIQEFEVKADAAPAQPPPAPAPPPPPTR